jgi:replicative DNA helicase
MVTIEKGGPKGLPTGFADVDRKLKGHGTHGGQLIIVAGRPGMGKSVFGTQVALHAAIEQNVPTAIFSLEMTQQELTLRALAAEASISLEGMLDGNTTPDELARLEVATRRLYPAPLWIDDTPSQSVLQIRAKARRMKAQQNIGLIVIDYLQYVIAEAENRTQEVGKITRGLKALAKELDIPIVALSQLSREVEKRAEKRPVMSDLRESGDIEQDADAVILLYRPEYYQGPADDKGNNLAGKAEAIIAKQRNGPTGSVELYFRAEAVRFEDAAHWGVSNDARRA